MSFDYYDVVWKFEELIKLPYKTLRDIIFHTTMLPEVKPWDNIPFYKEVKKIEHTVKDSTKVLDFLNEKIKNKEDAGAAHYILGCYFRVGYWRWDVLQGASEYLAAKDNIDPEKAFDNFYYADKNRFKGALYANSTLGRNRDKKPFDVGYIDTLEQLAHQGDKDARIDLILLVNKWKKNEEKESQRFAVDCRKVEREKQDKTRKEMYMIRTGI